LHSKSTLRDEPTLKSAHAISGKYQVAAIASANPREAFSGALSRNPEEDKMKAIATAILAGLIAGSLPTAASSEQLQSKDPTVSEQVNFADLNLNSAAGQQRLKNRISFAAYRLCLVDPPASPAPAAADPVCFRNAVSDGLAQMERAVAAANSHSTLASAFPLPRR
jgi:UrcA family protein